MKLDPSYLEYMTKEEFRVLTAIEIGMRNHELVPMTLIERISHLKRGCASSTVKLLLKNKFIAHENKKFDGYKLTYLGYDYLALQVFIRRGAIKEVLGKIGCGKESDIYKCVNDNGEHVILKFTRLGRTSFRTIKNNRDYIQHRTCYSWLYLSRLSAVKEFTFMDLLYKNGFPTPVPIEQNRHGIVMSLINGVPMQNISEIDQPKLIFDQCFDLLKRLAESGLIHSDFNEFNLLVEHNTKVVMIDFPQMVSTKHKNADFYFNRDVECIHTFFERRFHYTNPDTLDLNRIARLNDLDIQVKASGFIKKEIKHIDDFDIDLRDFEDDSDEDGEENKDNSDDGEDEEGQDQGECKEKIIPDSDDEEEEKELEEERQLKQQQNNKEQRRSKKHRNETKIEETQDDKQTRKEEQEEVQGNENNNDQEEDDDDDNNAHDFSPDLSEISFDEGQEVALANQDLFSDGEDEETMNLKDKANGDTKAADLAAEKLKKKKAKKAMMVKGTEEADGAVGVETKVLKEQIIIKEQDLAEKAKAFIQKQVQKQLKQKHKIQKKSNKTNNKVSAAEYM